MGKKIIITITIISVILLMIIGFIKYPLPCDYTNFAWGAVKKECDCLGIKIDTSCKICSNGKCSPCPDAGGGTGCIGVVKERRCYDFVKWEESNAKWNKVPCSN